MAHKMSAKTQATSQISPSRPHPTRLLLLHKVFLEFSCTFQACDSGPVSSLLVPYGFLALLSHVIQAPCQFHLLREAFSDPHHSLSRCQALYSSQHGSICHYTSICLSVCFTSPTRIYSYRGKDVVNIASCHSQYLTQCYKLDNRIDPHITMCNFIIAFNTIVIKTSVYSFS